MTTLVEDDDAIAHVEHEADVVLDQQDREPPIVGKSPDEATELGGLVVAETGRRLVEQQDRRLRCDRACDRHEPPSPVGQLVGTPVEIGLETELAHRRNRGRREIGPMRPDQVRQVGAAVARLGRGPQVLEHGEALEQLQGLEAATDAGDRAAAR